MELFEISRSDSACRSPNVELVPAPITLRADGRLFATMTLFATFAVTFAKPKDETAIAVPVVLAIGFATVPLFVMSKLPCPLPLTTPMIACVPIRFAALLPATRFPVIARSPSASRGPEDAGRSRGVPVAALRHDARGAREVRHDVVRDGRPRDVRDRRRGAERDEANARALRVRRRRAARDRVARDVCVEIVR